MLRKFLEKTYQKKLNIHCVGDVVVDEYYKVKVDRISPEFPMPIMTSRCNDSPIIKPGATANVVSQFKNFNVDAKLVCFDDHNQCYLSTFIDFHDINVLTRLKSYFGGFFPVKKRYLDGDFQVVRHDIELPYYGYISSDKLVVFREELLQVIKRSIKPDVAIFSDYDKGFFPLKGDDFIKAYSDSIIIVDPKRGDLDRWKNCTIFKPNAKEAEELSGFKHWIDQAKFFKDKLCCKAVVITHGSDQVCGIDEEKEFVFTPKKKVRVKSVVGAGDCFSAFLAMAVGHGFTVTESSEIAWNAGSIYVQGEMNRPIVPAEFIQDKIVKPEYLTKRDFKLVLTNGCYDVLHKGHMETLKFAKEQGDKLVLALNSDSSIKRLKGESRPIIPLEHRLAVLAVNPNVDFIVVFDEDTPENCIKTIAPEVLVKGGDYQGQPIVGQEYVKEVKFAPLVPNISTTILINDGKHN